MVPLISRQLLPSLADSRKLGNITQEPWAYGSEIGCMVEQLFHYGSAVRRVMYTTNAIESVNSSFRKVTRKGAFPHENAVRKIIYLRILELYKKMARASHYAVVYGTEPTCRRWQNPG